MSLSEGMTQYQQALKQGQKTFKDRVHTGLNPYLTVLDEFLSRDMIAGYINIGTLEIPTEYIIGTKTSGRKEAFAADFMPLLPHNTEFCRKWVALCAAHLTEGIRDPIVCFEYLGRGFVQEGNKRVSVLKSFNAVTIPARVTRIMPVWCDSEAIRVYYEFLDFFKLAGIYQIRFTTPGQYRKLQSALGFEADHIWTKEERTAFIAGYTRFREAYENLNRGDFRLTVSEALLTWLKVYPKEALNEKSVHELERSLDAVWGDVRSAFKDTPIILETEAAQPEKGFFPSLRSVVSPNHVKAAFIYEKEPSASRWIHNHDLGRQYLEEVMDGKVTTAVYIRREDETARELMIKAADEGAQVIFSTSQLQIGDCRRFAADHPGVRLLNCSLCMPFTGFRTYYCRMYQAKFIAGAIAGSLARASDIGYVAGLPLYGVPSDINAFALGARLTNPTVRIRLRWHCLENDAFDHFEKEGLRVISNLDLPNANLAQSNWGLTMRGDDGYRHALAAPYLNWGIFYEHVIQSILDGTWDSQGAKDGTPLNYWWGMRSNVIGIRAAEGLPDGAVQLMEILRSGITDGSIDPFRRRITDTDGIVRSDGSHWFSPEELMKMDWLCNCVDGTIPSYEDIPGSIPRSLVRLMGLHREQIPPDPQEVII